MYQKEIELPRHLINEILHLAQCSADREICGFIGLDSSKKYHCHPVQNVAKNPDNNFLMATEEQISTLKEMRNNNEEIFAVYHSHPTANATPSTSDIEQSVYSDAYYLIVSLNTKGVLEMRCYKLLHDENIVEITLQMKER